MKTQRVYIALVLLLSAAGCATGPVYVPPPRPEEGKALVYFYQEGESGIWVNGFYVNGQHVVSLYHKGYSWTALPEGRYTFSVGQPISVNKLKFDLSIKSGQDYFVRHIILPGTGKTLYVFELVRPAEARSEIIKYRYKESNQINLK
jgi:hypothetical protein